MTDDLERRLGDPPTGAPLDLTALRQSLARRAAADGILDVAYGSLDSPLGALTAFVTPRGLVRLSYPGEPHRCSAEGARRHDLTTGSGRPRAD